jgi:hypothetical protein
MSFMSGRDEVVVLCIMGWAMREESPADALPEAMCMRNLASRRAGTHRLAFPEELANPSPRIQPNVIMILLTVLCIVLYTIYFITLLTVES